MFGTEQAIWLLLGRLTRQLREEKSLPKSIPAGMIALPSAFIGQKVAWLTVMDCDVLSIGWPSTWWGPGRRPVGAGAGQHPRAALPGSDLVEHHHTVPAGVGWPGSGGGCHRPGRSGDRHADEHPGER